MNLERQKPILLLVDGHSLAFRSFYAFSKNGEGGLSTKEGLPTSVTYGFLKSLLDNCKELKPDGVAIAFDTAVPTFRHKADKNYKANRDVAPDIFFQDLEQLQSILKNELGLPLVMAPGYEADDVLGTIADTTSREGWTVRILSGDRDLFQLVDDKRDVAVLYMGGGPYSKRSGPILIDESGVLNKLGVLPKRVVDLKALTGDSSDNIPGVKGVGPKTAINLLNENEDLDGVYAVLNQLTSEGPNASRGSIKGAVKNKLINDRDNAYLSRFLAEIMVNVSLPQELDLYLGKVDRDGLSNCLEELELSSLSRQVDAFVSVFSDSRFSFNTASDQVNSNSQHHSKSEFMLSDKPSSCSDIPELDPKIITESKDLDDLVIRLMSFKDKDKPVALDTETTDLNPFNAELVGLGFCWGDKADEIAYVPIGHNSLDESTESINCKQLSVEVVLNSLSLWFSSSNHPKVLQNAKYDRLILLRHGCELSGVVVDTLLADYLRDPMAKHSLDAMSQREFNFTPKSFSELVGKGETFADVPIKDASLYCSMDVYLTRKLSFILKDQLLNMNSKLIFLLEQVEQPLEPVLALMEATGIKIDLEYLQRLSLDLSSNLVRLEKESAELAGSEFNLSSPKQLGEILFEKLNLDKRKSRRTKTGWSTNASVLEKLEDDHPLVPLVLEHRTVSKLLNTYVDALPQLVESETGRVHTDFNQAVTATGRLSSSNPNLQNIPIRTELSKRIRKAFLPQENWKLLSADYSQIELRILAHLSEEKALLEAYRKGDDVHKLTARLLFEKDQINSEERRLGKTINFGVIYGMGAQRFARSTGVSQQEAKEFLKRYRERYPKVFSFLEMQERLALSQGYVETILGRRRPFLFDKNGLGRLLGKDPLDIDLDIARRGGIEAQQLRAAANAPIQGSCADIIKVAMVQLQKKLKDAELPARLLLQVHDELVLEVDSSVLETVHQLVVRTMESAVNLLVPLVVDTGVGINWMDVK